MTTYKKKMKWGKALRIAKRFMVNVAVETHVAGSIRRHCGTVGDIDIVAVGVFPLEVRGAELKSGGNTMRTYVFEGQQINVMICERGYLGATMLYATGSGKFGQTLRCIARWKGFKLNRYGLFDRKTGELVTADEREIFRKCRRAYLEPHERKDNAKLVKITKEEAA